VIASKAVTTTVEFAPLSAAQEWRNLLSEEERAKASGMTNLAMRARFEIGRGLRRKMLADATGLPPGEITFVESEEGKPRALNAAGWDFNVSHSGDYVAVALGQGQVGVDLEQIRPVREIESIVDRYFHPDEAVAWHSLASGLREEAFFVLWSAREAAMKCVGFGLARGLSVTRVDPAILSERIAPARVGGAMIDVRQVEALRGYVAMVAQAAA
jgi:4'-phosphopantetheinyl transferase